MNCWSQTLEDQRGLEFEACAETQGNRAAPASEAEGPASAGGCVLAGFEAELRIPLMTL